MHLSTTVAAAIVGFSGVLAGGLIQATVARTNRRHERSRALEAKRVDKRIEVYVDLVKYVIQRETIAGRRVSAFEPTVVREPRAADGETAEDESGLSGDTIAKLVTFTSTSVDLMFAAWKVQAAQSQSAESSQKLFHVICELGWPPNVEKVYPERVERLVKLSSEAAERQAHALVLQIRAEIAGQGEWRRKSRNLRGAIFGIKESRRIEANASFIDTTSKDLSHKLNLALAEIRSSGGLDKWRAVPHADSDLAQHQSPVT